MHPLKQQLLSTLRDKETRTPAFRRASDRLATLLVDEATTHLAWQERKVHTPLGSAEGKALTQRVILVPILRAGLALLSAFLQFFEDAPVGFIGLKRDESTATASQYYSNLPAFTETDHVLLLDPMLATGGSTIHAVKTLISHGVKEAHIHFCGVVSAPEGKQALSLRFPEVSITVLAEDEKLNEQKFIVPGLGDYGDRYFGTTYIDHQYTVKRHV